MLICNVPLKQYHCTKLLVLYRRGLAQGCAFWGFRFVDTAPHFRDESPRKPQFLGRE